MFKCPHNVGPADKAIRITLGIALLAFALFAPKTIPYTWLGFLGIIPLATGIMGFCGLYSLLGLNTCQTTTPQKKK